MNRQINWLLSPYPDKLEYDKRNAPKLNQFDFNKQRNVFFQTVYDGPHNMGI